MQRQSASHWDIVKVALAKLSPSDTACTTTSISLWRCPLTVMLKEPGAAEQLGDGESCHIVLLLDTLRGSQDIVNGPLSLQRERRLRPRGKIRAVIFGVIALAFLGGAVSDLVTGAYNSIGSFLFFALFGWASLDQMAKAYRKLPAAQAPQTGA